MAKKEYVTPNTSIVHLKTERLLGSESMTINNNPNQKVTTNDKVFSREIEWDTWTEWDTW